MPNIQKGSKNWSDNLDILFSTLFQVKKVGIKYFHELFIGTMHRARTAIQSATL